MGELEEFYYNGGANVNGGTTTGGSTAGASTAGSATAGGSTAGLIPFNGGEYDLEEHCETLTYEQCANTQGCMVDPEDLECTSMYLHLKKQQSKSASEQVSWSQAGIVGGVAFTLGISLACVYTKVMQKPKDNYSIMLDPQV